VRIGWVKTEEILGKGDSQTSGSRRDFLRSPGYAGGKKGFRKGPPARALDAPRKNCLKETLLPEGQKRMQQGDVPESTKTN